MIIRNDLKHTIMDETRKKSVFNILLLRICLIVVVFNLILASWQIRETIILHKENTKILRERIQNEIITIMKSWYSAEKSLGDIFALISENAINKLINLHSEHDLKSVNLPEQAKLLGVNLDYFDFFIFENNICINTTSPPDSGLNFYSLGPLYNKSPMEFILERGWFYGEPFAFEEGTKRLKAYGYKATKDKKYIVEAGCYSETADEMLDLYREQLRTLVRENEQLLSVNIWLLFNKLTSFLDDSITFPDQDSIIIKTYQEKSHLEKIYSDDNRLILAEIQYIEFEPNINQRIVITTLTDITDNKTQIVNIVAKHLLIILVFLVLLSIVLILATRKFKTTITDLLRKTSLIANGALHERVAVTGNNEFTTLAEQFNYMVKSLENSQNELKQKSKIIEENNKALQERNDEITAQNDEISAQRDEIEAQRDLVTKQKDQILEQKNAMTDSIQYASRIQTAILPPDEVLKYLLPKHFILYKPRDIVSGDFYWLTQKREKIIIVVADCTGHGVPGAFMSMLGSALLNDIVNNIEVLQPNLILDELRDQVMVSLRQTGKEEEQKDGMDIAMCVLDKDDMTLQYSGGYNPLYFIRKGELTEIKADKMPIGISSKAGESFTNHELSLQKGDALYMFSDGYVDQFGGPNGKKFLVARFKELLLDIQNKIMHEQREILEQTITEWMGLTGQHEEKYDQVDDIIVMGIKI